MTSGRPGEGCNCSISLGKAGLSLAVIISASFTDIFFSDVAQTTVITLNWFHPPSPTGLSLRLSQSGFSFWSILAWRRRRSGKMRRFPALTGKPQKRPHESREIAVEKRLGAN